MFHFLISTTLFRRALGSVFVPVFTCFSLCWHAARHLCTCHVELACEVWIIMQRYSVACVCAREICSLRTSSRWSLVQLWNLRFRCGVWTWFSAPMLLRVFTSSRRLEWWRRHTEAVAAAITLNSETGREKGQIKKIIKGQHDSSEEICYQTYWHVKSWGRKWKTHSSFGLKQTFKITLFTFLTNIPLRCLNYTSAVI